MLVFFKQSGFTNAFAITAITTGIKIGTILIIAVTSDRFGRRNIVVYSGAWCTIMLLIVGILGLLPQTAALKNLLIVIACFWSVGNAGLGALGWTYCGEVSSQKLRARTAGLSAAFAVIFGLTFNTSVPIMRKSSSSLFLFGLLTRFQSTPPARTGVTRPPGSSSRPVSSRPPSRSTSSPRPRGATPPNSMRCTRRASRLRMAKYVTDVQKRQRGQYDLGA
jgi:MFS family permease